MKKKLVVWIAALGCMAAALAQPAGEVKVTPLGGHDGELCPQDRALILEDPTGTRILYDPGRTVAGASDPRLGKIDIILVTHMHGDHVGNAHNKAPNSGTCESPDMSVSALPNSNAVNIALAKKAKIVTGSEMPAFFAGKLKANGGDPRDSILARFGGSVKLGGVTIATVPALHSNGLDPDYIGGELGKNMKDAGIAGYVGAAAGAVVAATGTTGAGVVLVVWHAASESREAAASAILVSMMSPRIFLNAAITCAEMIMKQASD